MTPNREPISAEQIRQLQLLAQSLRFGTLTLVFQDGKLIQIDKNEKIRLKNE
ncbi:MAG: YezD family protein [Faecalibacterium sp.]